MSLKFVPIGPINNIIFQHWLATSHSLDQWWFILLMYICVTSPQWVNECPPTAACKPILRHRNGFCIQQGLSAAVTFAILGSITACYNLCGCKKLSYIMLLYISIFSDNMWGMSYDVWTRLCIALLCCGYIISSLWFVPFIYRYKESFWLWDRPRKDDIVMRGMQTQVDCCVETFIL